MGTCAAMDPKGSSTRMASSHVRIPRLQRHILFLRISWEKGAALHLLAFGAASARLRARRARHRVPARSVADHAVVVGVAICTALRGCEEGGTGSVGQGAGVGIAGSGGVLAGIAVPFDAIAGAVAAAAVGAERCRPSFRSARRVGCAGDGNAVAGDEADVDGGFGVGVPFAFDPSAQRIGYAIANLEVPTSRSSGLAEGAAGSTGNVATTSYSPRGPGQDDQILARIVLKADFLSIATTAVGS